jgi:hypothetical protein
MREADSDCQLSIADSEPNRQLKIADGKFYG